MCLLIPSVYNLKVAPAKCFTVNRTLRYYITLKRYSSQ